METRLCLYCSKPFNPKKPNHYFCSDSHRQHYSKGKSWEGFFKRLLNNNAKKRRKISVQFLVDMVEKQQGRCAISGVELTRISGEGVITTNASLDRIDSSRGYSRDNVRLVCQFVNSFRGNLSDKDFMWWCRKIVEHGGT